MLMIAGAAKYLLSSEKCKKVAEILSKQHSNSLNARTVQQMNCINQWFETSGAQATGWY